MKAKIKTDTIVRTIVLVLALINQVLAIKGKEVLPVTEDEVYQLVSLVVTIGASLWAWWKNNSFTEPAIMGDQLKDQLKREAERK
jgi:SPP1 family holin